MSRSRRHTPIRGNAGRSEKKDKKILHGKMRTIMRRQLRPHSVDSDSVFQPDYDIVLNQWSMSKDGKSYFGDYKNWIYFTEEDYKKALRK